MKSGPKLSHFPSYLDRFPPSIGIGIHQEPVHRKSLIKGDMSICLSLPPRDRVVLRSLPSVIFTGTHQELTLIWIYSIGGNLSMRSIM